MSEDINRDFYEKYGCCEACYMDLAGEDGEGCTCWLYRYTESPNIDKLIAKTKVLIAVNGR